MRGNLVPDKRRDINGRLVTRYVKPHADTTALFDIPAPSITFTDKVELSESQLEQWDISLSPAAFTPDKALDALLTNRIGAYDFAATDAEVYGMLSVLEPKDAVPMMHHGINSPEEATRFLKKNNLERLIVRREDHAQEALHRRLPAESYLKVCETQVIRDVPLGRLLDAVETHAMHPIRKYGFHADVLRGDINVKDISVLGAELISCHSSPADIKEILWDLKAGRSKYDANQLKHLIESADKSNCSVSFADELVFRCGVEQTLAFKSIEEAYRMMEYVDRLNRDEEKINYEATRSIIRYYDEMCAVIAESDSSGDSQMVRYDKVIEFHDAGVTPQAAWKGMQENMTVQQTLAISNHDVPPSVSGGWL